MRFVWDESKNVRNQKAHGLSFEEASTLFTVSDDFLEIFDQAHSHDEDRFIAIGPILRGVIVVVYTERDDDVFRIISARFATAQEVALYHSHAGRR